MPSGQEEERQQLEGGSDGGSMVSVFIAKFTYVPAEMSPNPNFEQELAIQAGTQLLFSCSILSFTDVILCVFTEFYWHTTVLLCFTGIVL